MNKKHSIIAILGMPGAGKSTLTAYLKEKYNFETIYFGGQVLAEIKKRGLEVTPDNERHVREDLRKQHGMAAMAVLATPAIGQALKASKTVLIDGIYSMEELELLQHSFPDQIVTIAIHASRDIREKRMTNRPERPLTAAQLKNRDLVEVKNINKAPPIVLADFHYVNDGEEASMIGWIDALLSSNRLNIG